MALSLIKSDSLAAGVGSNVLEQLAMLCDGQNYTVSSGTYTSENVTAKQELTTSYVDITGSTISYTPPSGTTCVVYEFSFAASFTDAFQISHYKFFIDSDEVVYHRRNLGGDGQQTFYNLKSVIPIGGTADTNTGRQSSWTSAKTLKLQAREYSATYEGKLHSSYYWDGASSEQFHIPSLTITSLG
jgi:hypothetical protein